MFKKTVGDYLDETAARLPEKKAFVDPDRSVTFSQLREEARRVAQGIAETGAFKKPVAIYLEKSVTCAVSMYGVIYSGCFYTVLDTEMPQGRIDKILHTLEPELFLTDRAHVEEVKAFAGDGRILIFEELQEKPYDKELLEKVHHKIQSSDLMYVLFTSGSTGNPKGVAASHTMFIHYMAQAKEVYEYEESDVLLNQVPFYFIMASTDLYTVAFGGCTTHIVPRMYYAFPAMLVNYIAENKVTFLMWVPTAMAMIANTKAFEINDMSSIKKVNFGGEVMPIKVLREWQTHIPGAYYVNGYGSTEMTDGGTYYRIDREFEDQATLPIGKPYPNVDALVLDEEDHLIEEPDIAGELCIRSPSLSYGYYNDPERTKEVFVQNPLNTAYEEKIYRTGDLVKYNSYGELEYVGRKDFQIKHRGQRIELGEIEANVLSVEEVEECACLYHQPKERIVLYYTGKIEPKELGKRLKELLPPYMLPGKRYQLEQMPHNLNGKIDRAALKAKMEETKK